MNKNKRTHFEERILSDVRETFRQIREEVASLEELFGELKRETEFLGRAEQSSDSSEEPHDEKINQELDKMADLEKAKMVNPQAIREKFDLTQQELAQIMGVSSAAVSVWEKGESYPNSTNSAKLIHVSNMTKDEIEKALNRTRRIGPEDIRVLRYRLGVSQKKLAEMLDVTAASVNHWENGKNRPQSENRQKITDLLEKTEKENHNIDKPSPEKVKSLRKKEGVTQREMGDKIGVTGSTVSNWETGRANPSPEHLKKMCESVS